MLHVPISQSKNTGVKPSVTIGLIVVGKPAATVITSSPYLTCLTPSLYDIREDNAIKFALEPELTVIQ